MMEGLYILNDGVVGLFGVLLSAAFCNVAWNRCRRRWFALAVVFLGMLQALLFAVLGADKLRLWYPVVTHLPCVLLLGALSRQPLWSLTAVLIAYLCCQLRRWLALLFVALCSGGAAMQAAAELAITIPLALALLRWAAPGVRDMGNRPISVQLQFSLIPAVQYGFDYLTCVYTDLLIRGVAAAVEFMPFVCALAYLAFTLNTTKSLRRQSELEYVQYGLDMQIRQASRQIEALQKSQMLAAAYRHDLRHHLQYLSACMEDGRTQQAQAYISRLNEEITRQAVTCYCENIPVNLVVSAFAARACEADVKMDVYLRVGERLGVSDNDLCVLLSNVLENALYACVEAKATGRDGRMALRGYEKDGRLFFKVTNSLARVPEFENGVPVTREAGHGLGVRSICAVVEKYGGLYSFEATQDEFVLTLSV